MFRKKCMSHSFSILLTYIFLYMVQTIIFYHFLFTFIHEGNIKEENIGYAVFKKRISTDPAGLWGGGRGVTPPAPSPFNIRRMARCLKTT